MDELQRISTAQLIEELKIREGVDIKIAGPYERENIEVEGPAVVLIVTD